MPERGTLMELGVSGIIPNKKKTRFLEKNALIHGTVRVQNLLIVDLK